MVYQKLFPALNQFLGTEARDFTHLEGGDEALVLRAESAAGPLVIHISPPWRTQAELVWAHSIARYARKSVPQVVAPLKRGDTTLFDLGGRLAAVFPYIDGQMLDRDNAALRDEAARLLASIHLTLLHWEGGPHPPSGAGKPVPPHNSPAIHDPTLDNWWSEQKKHGFLQAPTHGDYYRRNLLCVGHRITGVIDWHDSSVRPLVVELAGAAFELCRDDEHVLDFERADAFVAAYRGAGGPVPESELTLLLPLMRLWIRDDIRNSLAYDQGQGVNEYAEKQISAFQALAACSWRPKL